MELYSLRIRPLSSWRTPWQADTLFGLLCWACARRQGGDRLRELIIEPSLAGAPPFVVSDAFPAGWFPAPATLRSLASLSAYRREAGSNGARVKQIRKARWLHADGFREFQQGRRPPAEAFAARSPIYTIGEIHNQLGRSTNTTSDDGQLFVQDAWTLHTSVDELRVFLRTTPSFLTTLLELFEELSRGGFGADTSTGRGEFELVSAIEPSDLDRVSDATGCIALSTFQPGAGDPTQGVWETRIKYGKLGPDFGFDNVFKRPMVMLRPGAIFGGTRGWLGRAIPMKEFLAHDVVEILSSRAVKLIHPAFSVTVPHRSAMME